MKPTEISFFVHFDSFIEKYLWSDAKEMTGGLK